jgi:beta-lactamase regulating signal transducer with metallopeptidase domain
VLALCIPSYLRYEENTGIERLGPFCLIMAVLGLGLCLASIYRGVAALRQNYFVEQNCNRLRHIQSSPALPETSIYLATEESIGLPLLALVGILRPRLIVSQRLLDTLSAEQVDVVFCHESAHRTSRDNLKRLLFVLAPDIFPFTRSFRTIERLWQHYAELAADDKASAGRPERSVALAEALIRVARLGNSECSPILASSLSTQNVELAMRVDRLLAVHSPAQQEKAAGSSGRIFLLTCATLLVCTALPKALSVLYPWLETLLH